MQPIMPGNRDCLGSSDLPAMLALLENEAGLKMAIIEWRQRNVSRFLCCGAR